jgi:PAS domain S-box-containing protein
MLIGFTVMQHAFAGGVTTGIVSDVERRALALTGAGDMIWDWDVSADKVFTSPETEALLGLKRGTLEGPAAGWLDVLHPLDRDRFRAVLDSVLEQRRGRLSQDFRLRTPDGHYLWFALKARPVVGPMARWCASWARSPTSPSSKTRRSDSCTTRCTTI